MKKIMSIVGARPQFIKAAALSRVIRKEIDEILVHTGQHYDDNMSRVFFDQLAIPEPDYHLDVGSGSHGKQTGLMLQRLETVMIEEKPDAVLIYGDTNSTLAGALAAVKLHIPLAHVEAGLRSYNRAMPEEVNRVLADQCSQWLFCPTRAACDNLARENINKGVFLTGDVMYDAALFYAKIAEEKSAVLNRLKLSGASYFLATVHRASNTDDAAVLARIITALGQSPKPVVWPVHPRTRHKLTIFGLDKKIRQMPQILMIDPVDYLDMISLEKNADLILTDSGGVQKEAYFYQVPCVTLREETEWVETLQDGWNQLSGSNTEQIVQAMQSFEKPKKSVLYYGNGRASDNILQFIMKKT